MSSEGIGYTFCAIPSIYGFDIQGVLAVLKALRCIDELFEKNGDSLDSKENVEALLKDYHLEVEHYEDYAIVKGSKYINLTQVKTGSAKMSVVDIANLLCIIEETDCRDIVIESEEKVELEAFKSDYQDDVNKYLLALKKTFDELVKYDSFGALSSNNEPEINTDIEQDKNLPYFKLATPFNGNSKKFSVNGILYSLGKRDKGFSTQAYNADYDKVKEKALIAQRSIAKVLEDFEKLWNFIKITQISDGYNKVVEQVETTVFSIFSKLPEELKRNFLCDPEKHSRVYLMSIFQANISDYKELLDKDKETRHEPCRLSFIDIFDCLINHQEIDQAKYNLYLATESIIEGYRNFLVDDLDRIIPRDDSCPTQSMSIVNEIYCSKCSQRVNCNPYIQFKRIKEIVDQDKLKLFLDLTTMFGVESHKNKMQPNDYLSTDDYANHLYYPFANIEELKIRDDYTIKAEIQHYNQTKYLYHVVNGLKNENRLNQLLRNNTDVLMHLFESDYMLIRDFEKAMQPNEDEVLTYKYYFKKEDIKNTEEIAKKNKHKINKRESIDIINLKNAKDLGGIEHE